MNRKLSSVLLLSLLLCGCYIDPSGGQVDPVDPEVVASPTKLSAVLEELAQQLAHDGTLDDPRAVTTTDVAILFDSIVEYSHLGEGAYTQDVADQISAALEKLEPDGESKDLDKQTRGQAVRIISDLAKSVGGSK